MAAFFEKIDLQTAAMCAASALFGAALSFILTSRSLSSHINPNIEKEKDKVSRRYLISNISHCWLPPLSTFSNCRLRPDLSLQFCCVRVTHHNHHNRHLDFQGTSQSQYWVTWSGFNVSSPFKFIMSSQLSGLPQCRHWRSIRKDCLLQMLAIW